MNIKSLLSWGVQELASTSESARLDAELLLAHVLGVSRVYLIAHDDEEVPLSHQEEYRAFVQRRALNEPIAYLVGRKEFWGLDFVVTPAVLIPRPETEAIVERALAYAAQIEGPLSCLDLGTGSGCLAIAVAAELKKQKREFSFLAVDKSGEALQIARRNAEFHGLCAELSFLESDWFSAISEEKKFHIILSNPPYLCDDDPVIYAGAKFEPSLALYGASNVQYLLNEVPKWLYSHGRFLMEIGHSPESVGISLLGRKKGLELFSSNRCYFLEITASYC